MVSFVKRRVLSTIAEISDPTSRYDSSCPSCDLLDHSVRGLGEEFQFPCIVEVAEVDPTGKKPGEDGFAGILVPVSRYVLIPRVPNPKVVNTSTSVG